MIKFARIGTRGSDLALRQTTEVAERLFAAHPDLGLTVEVVRTAGDQQPDVPLAAFGDAGAFTSALERALASGEVDLAVHSYKDLPTRLASGLSIGAVAGRRDPADVLISRLAYTLDTLPRHARIGTSSRRRAAQLLHYRPDLDIAEIRGNIDTRLRKALQVDSPYDAIVLARAGLERLDRLDVVTETLPLAVMLPAPAQAALAVQCRDEDDWRMLLEPVHDETAAAAVDAERAFLAGLGGGCALPVAALAVVENGALWLRGRVTALDGSAQIELSERYPYFYPQDAKMAGRALADRAAAQGALDLLEETR